MTESELFDIIDRALPGRAFLILVAKDTKEPYLVFQRVTQSPQNTLCGYANADEVHYRIDSYARTHASALATMETVMKLLRACPDPPLVTNEQDLYEQDTRIHRTSIDISTWYQPERTT